jgi:Guanine nucleotide exchange factor synembryn
MMLYHRNPSFTIDSRLVAPLIQLLLSYPAKDFRPPLTNIVHGLLNLSLPLSQSDLFPCDSPTRVVQRIIDTIDQTIPQDTETIDDTSIDENLSPVFALLSGIYDTAPSTVQVFMKERLLPTEMYVPWNY